MVLVGLWAQDKRRTMLSNDVQMNSSRKRDGTGWALWLGRLVCGYGQGSASQRRENGDESFGVHGGFVVRTKLYVIDSVEDPLPYICSRGLLFVICDLRSLRRLPN